VLSLLLPPHPNVVDAPSLKLFKTRVNGALSNMV